MSLTADIPGMSSDTITLDGNSILGNSIPYLSSSMIGSYPQYSIYTTDNTGGGSLTHPSTIDSTFYTNNTQSWPSTGGGLQVNGDADFTGKVRVNGQDIGEFMEKISRRLAILVPDPEKLEHFEALKKAYDHYKTLEALCELPKKNKE